MSTVLMAAAVIVLSVALSVIGFDLVRRFVPFETRQQHNDVAGFIYAVLGVLYAVILAFVVVVVWQQYEEARDDNHAEANALADIHALANRLAEPDRGQVQGLARAYAEAVVDEEWELLAQGRESERAWDIAGRLQSTVAALQPRSPDEQVIYDRLLTQASALMDQRRLRLLHTQAAVPPLLMWLLVGGGIITISFSYLFGLRNTVAHALMVAALTALTAASIYLINVLDSPYAGDFRLQPETLHMVLQRLSGQ